LFLKSSAASQPSVEQVFELLSANVAVSRMLHPLTDPQGSLAHEVRIEGGSGSLSASGKRSFLYIEFAIKGSDPSLWRLTAIGL
jgi:hypothetical protein